MWKSSKNQRLLRGLTLIELIIIVVIIFILALFVYAQIEQRGTAQGRDIKRVSEINNLRTALQLYYMDYGQYPTSTETEDWCSLEQTDDTKGDYCDYLITELEPYLAEIPGDPLYPATSSGKFYSYQYRSTSSGEGYKIHTDLEIRDPYELYSAIGKAIE